MITPMKKYAFLVYHRDYDSFLHGIQELGVVHVIEKQSGVLEDETVRRMHNKLSELQTAANFLSKKLPEGSTPNPFVTDEYAYESIERLQELQKTQDKLELRLSTVVKDISQLTPWGDFSWNIIQKLKQQGWQLTFYTCPTRKIDSNWNEKYYFEIISSDSSITNFVIISKAEELIALDLECVHLPEKNLSALLTEEDSIKEQLQQIADSYSSLAIDSINTLKQVKTDAMADLDFRKVVLNTQKQADDRLMLLEGWAPAENHEEISNFLNENGVVWFSHKAEKEDKAPIKLTNNKFAKLFHPITELYEMPAYGELDLTPFFAPFFVMFFGLCLGDAGYGVLLLLIGLIARRKVKEDMKPIMTLVSILGGGTIIFGFLSGTLFGIELAKVEWPWIQRFKSIMLDSNDLFSFSLIIGSVQIIFGMTIKAIGQTIRFGFKNALSTWGWLIAIIGCGGVYGMQKLGVLSQQTATVGYYLTGGIAFLGIFILNDIKRNMLINIGAGLWDTYNMLTGLLGDVLSYVRLFALGISGAVLGLVFNDLAIKMSPDIPVVGFLVSAIILLFGHGMNIFMAGLGAFVHPLRLTFVEFYKNAGFEGGGKKYTPFRKG